MNLEEKVTQLIGEASMCWNPIPTGVFDSTHAMKIVEQIIQTVTQATREEDLRELEKLDAYDGIYDQGEDEYGRHHSKNMGAAVLVEEVEKYYRTKINQR